MGTSHSIFSDEQLEEYQEKTSFTKKEILHVYERFKDIDATTVKADRNARLSKSQIAALKELSVNPFRERMCDVFSSSDDGCLSFEDFLYMMSVFSISMPKDKKVEQAFRIYDFDNDDMISDKDLRKVIELLVGSDNQLSDNDMEDIVNEVMNEADMDGDGSLSFTEFQHVMSKSADFVNTFCIRL